MAFNEEEQGKYAEVISQFINEHRPPENVRSQVDLGYNFNNNKQSLEIFEIRPRFNNPEEKIKCYIAKAIWVKSQKIWKVYWQRADLNWHTYEPVPSVNTLNDFLQLVEEDQYACFWG